MFDKFKRFVEFFCYIAEFLALICGCCAMFMLLYTMVQAFFFW